MVFQTFDEVRVGDLMEKRNHFEVLDFICLVCNIVCRFLKILFLISQSIMSCIGTK